MYEIRIIHKRTIQKEVPGQWTVVDKEGNYGHAPSQVREVNDDIEVYKQVVDALDLPAVIVAINGGYSDFGVEMKSSNPASNS